MVRVRDHAGAAFSARADRHPQCVEDEFGLEVVAHRPADDPPAEDVLDGGEEEEALPGLHVLEVADPEPVRLGPREVAVDEIRSRRPHRVSCGCARPSSATIGAP